MFNTAKEEDEKAGNGKYQLTLKKEWSHLPTYRNNHEFGFIAGTYGYHDWDDFI